MAKKLLMVTVRGTQSTWSFEFYGDPQYLDEWRTDGLDVVEVCNIIPSWLPPWAIKPWCVAQDLFNFKSPWGKP